MVFIPRQLEFDPDFLDWLKAVKSANPATHHLIKIIFKNLKNTVIDQLDNFIPDPIDEGYGILTFDGLELDWDCSFIEFYLFYDAHQIMILDVEII